MVIRQSKISRKTKETQIELDFAIDGKSSVQVDTGIAFFDHMLDLFAHHGQFNLDLKVQGDLEVDFHHTVEDVGICLGKAINEALGDRAGIARYASALIPMDEALCQLAMDLSNRPYLSLQAKFPKTKIGQFDVELVEEFFRAVTQNAGITLHIQLLSGQNLHHMVEAIFKAFGRVLDQATRVDPKNRQIPSTKGVL